MSDQRLRQEPIIVFGYFKDKFELCKVAAAKAKEKFRADGNIDVVKVGDFDEELGQKGGHVCVVEFVCKEASAVRGGYNNNSK